MSKSVLITGGSGDIGSAIAVHFASKGYRVAITYNKSKSRADALVTSLTAAGTDAIALYCDVANPQSVLTLAKQVEYRFGGIDVLINNAGISSQKLITDLTDSEWNDILSTNLSGTFYCCRSVVPLMVKKQQGSIVNISSIWGITGASLEVAYSTTKAGIIGLTKALAKELGPSNIRVNCVAPGVIDTKMNSNLDIAAMGELADQTPLCRIGTPDEVARAVYYMAAEADFVTGQVLSPNGGIVI